MILYPILVILITILYDNYEARHIDSKRRHRSFDPKIFTTCIDGLGCVDVSEKWYDEVYRPKNLEPLDRNTIRTEFIFMKKLQNDTKDLVYDILQLKRETIEISGFKKGTCTKFMIHDFTGNGRTGWIKHLVGAFAHHTNCNLVSIDWEAGAEPPFEQAVVNARIVALEAIAMINMIKANFSQSIEMIQIIGHGIGAHIAGYIGKNISGLGRITALDPTGPYFEQMSKEIRLDYTDANYVEVIHTDANKKKSHGASTQLGHVDFYVNNAGRQPGCNDTTLLFTDIKRDGLKEGKILPACSHKRSFKYFIESIENTYCQFIGVLCKNFQEFEKGRCFSCENNSCLSFGLKAPAFASTWNHSYYLITHNKKPYCVLAYSVTMVIDANIKAREVEGFFEMILVDSNNTIANATTANSRFKNRVLKPGGRYEFLFYTSPPRLGVIKKAKVKWTKKSPKFCIFCTTSVYVSKIEIKPLELEHTKTITSYLCPQKDTTEIENDDYVTFKLCNSKSCCITSPPSDVEFVQSTLTSATLNETSSPENYQGISKKNENIEKVEAEKTNPHTAHGSNQMVEINNIPSADSFDSTTIGSSSENVNANTQSKNYKATSKKNENIEKVEAEKTNPHAAHGSNQMVEINNIPSSDSFDSTTIGSSSENVNANTQSKNYKAISKKNENIEKVEAEEANPQAAHGSNQMVEINNIPSSDSFDSTIGSSSENVYANTQSKNYQAISKKIQNIHKVEAEKAKPHAAHGSNEMVEINNIPSSDSFDSTIGSSSENVYANTQSENYQAISKKIQNIHKVEAEKAKPHAAHGSNEMVEINNIPSSDSFDSTTIGSSSENVYANTQSSTISTEPEQTTSGKMHTNSYNDNFDIETVHTSVEAPVTTNSVATTVHKFEITVNQSEDSKSSEQIHSTTHQEVGNKFESTNRLEQSFSETGAVDLKTTNVFERSTSEAEAPSIAIAISSDRQDSVNLGTISNEISTNGASIKTEGILTHHFSLPISFEPSCSTYQNFMEPPTEVSFSFSTTGTYSSTAKNTLDKAHISFDDTLLASNIESICGKLKEVSGTDSPLIFSNHLVLNDLSIPTINPDLMVIKGAHTDDSPCKNDEVDINVNQMSVDAADVLPSLEEWRLIRRKSDHGRSTKDIGLKKVRYKLKKFANATAVKKNVVPRDKTNKLLRDQKKTTSLIVSRNKRKKKNRKQAEVKTVTSTTEVHCEIEPSTCAEIKSEVDLTYDKVKSHLKEMVGAESGQSTSAAHSEQNNIEVESKLDETQYNIMNVSDEECNAEFGRVFNTPKEDEGNIKFSKSKEKIELKEDETSNKLVGAANVQNSAMSMKITTPADDCNDEESIFINGTKLKEHLNNAINALNKELDELKLINLKTPIEKNKLYEKVELNSPKVGAANAATTSLIMKSSKDEPDELCADNLEGHNGKGANLKDDDEFITVKDDFNKESKSKEPFEYITLAKARVGAAKALQSSKNVEVNSTDSEGTDQKISDENENSEEECLIKSKANKLVEKVSNPLFNKGSGYFENNSFHSSFESDIASNRCEAINSDTFTFKEDDDNILNTNIGIRGTTEEVIQKNKSQYKRVGAAHGSGNDSLAIAFKSQTTQEILELNKKKSTTLSDKDLEEICNAKEAFVKTQLAEDVKEEEQIMKPPIVGAAKADQISVTLPVANESEVDESKNVETINFTYDDFNIKTVLIEGNTVENVSHVINFKIKEKLKQKSTTPIVTTAKPLLIEQPDFTVEECTDSALFETVQLSGNIISNATQIIDFNIKEKIKSKISTTCFSEFIEESTITANSATTVNAAQSNPSASSIEYLTAASEIEASTITESGCMYNLDEILKELEFSLGKILAIKDSNKTNNVTINNNTMDQFKVEAGQCFCYGDLKNVTPNEFANDLDRGTTEVFDIINTDIKNVPEVLTQTNVHVVEDNAPETTCFTMLQMEESESLMSGDKQATISSNILQSAGENCEEIYSVTPASINQTAEMHVTNQELATTMQEEIEATQSNNFETALITLQTVEMFETTFNSLPLKNHHTEPMEVSTASSLSVELTSVEMPHHFAIKSSTTEEDFFKSTIEIILNETGTDFKQIQSKSTHFSLPEETTLQISESPTILADLSTIQEMPTSTSFRTNESTIFNAVTTTILSIGSTIEEKTSSISLATAKKIHLTEQTSLNDATTHNSISKMTKVTQTEAQMASYVNKSAGGQANADGAEEDFYTSTIEIILNETGTDFKQIQSKSTHFSLPEETTLRISESPTILADLSTITSFRTNESTTFNAVTTTILSIESTIEEKTSSISLGTTKKILLTEQISLNDATTQNSISKITKVTQTEAQMASDASKSAVGQANADDVRITVDFPAIEVNDGKSTELLIIQQYLTTMTPNIEPNAMYATQYTTHSTNPVVENPNISMYDPKLSINNSTDGEIDLYVNKKNNCSSIEVEAKPHSGAVPSDRSFVIANQPMTTTNCSEKELYKAIKMCADLRNRRRSKRKVKRSEQPAGKYVVNIGHGGKLVSHVPMKIVFDLKENGEIVGTTEYNIVHQAISDKPSIVDYSFVTPGGLKSNQKKDGQSEINASGLINNKTLITRTAENFESNRSNVTYDNSGSFNMSCLNPHPAKLMNGSKMSSEIDNEHCNAIFEHLKNLSDYKVAKESDETDDSCCFDMKDLRKVYHQPLRFEKEFTDDDGVPQKKRKRKYLNVNLDDDDGYLMDDFVAKSNVKEMPNDPNKNKQFLRYFHSAFVGLHDIDIKPQFYKMYEPENDLAENGNILLAPKEIQNEPADEIKKEPFMKYLNESLQDINCDQLNDANSLKNDTKNDQNPPLNFSRAEDQQTFTPLVKMNESQSGNIEMQEIGQNISHRAFTINPLELKYCSCLLEEASNLQKIEESKIKQIGAQGGVSFLDPSELTTQQTVQNENNSQHNFLEITLVPINTSTYSDFNQNQLLQSTPNSTNLCAIPTTGQIETAHTNANHLNTSSTSLEDIQIFPQFIDQCQNKLSNGSVDTFTFLLTNSATPRETTTEILQETICETKMIKICNTNSPIHQSKITNFEDQTNTSNKNAVQNSYEFIIPSYKLKNGKVVGRNVDRPYGRMNNRRRRFKKWRAHAN